MQLPVAKQHQPHVAAAPCSQAVLVCTESNFFNFKLEYLRENEFLSGAQMGWIHEKNRGRKSRDTAPFKVMMASQLLQPHLLMKMNIANDCHVYIS